MKAQFLPETYMNYSYMLPIEEHGIIGGVIILTWLPILAFVLSFLMLRRKNMRLFYALLQGFLLVSGILILANRFSLLKTNLCAVLVLLVAFVYWLVWMVKNKKVRP